MDKATEARVDHMTTLDEAWEMYLSTRAQQMSDVKQVAETRRAWLMGVAFMIHGMQQTAPHGEDAVRTFFNHVMAQLAIYTAGDSANDS